MHHVRQPFVSGASKQTNAHATLSQTRQHWTFFKIPDVIVAPLRSCLLLKIHRRHQLCFQLILNYTGVP